MSSVPDALADAAIAVLSACDPLDKLALTRRWAQAWRAGRLAPGPARQPLPDRPGRPPRPELRPPRDMPRRRPGTPAGRIALLHALAHIELNAVDLAWDIVARFDRLPDGTPLPRAFFDDWVRVADEEARHFGLLSQRLAELGAAYGDLPAHEGLWQASEATAHELIARLAVVPMVLEARGLDVTPGMAATLRRLGDPDSAAILDIIHQDEIGHVAAGRRWLEAACQAAGLDPAATWTDRVRRLFRGSLKRPFDRDSRDRAGFPADWYEPLAGPEG
jgi:uncharacterized ferritin-like protein (DUF455 family)